MTQSRNNREYSSMKIFKNCYINRFKGFQEVREYLQTNKIYFQNNNVWRKKTTVHIYFTDEPGLQSNKFNRNECKDSASNS